MSHQIVVSSTGTSNIFQINDQNITFTPDATSINTSILNYPVDIANKKLETNINNTKVSTKEPGGLQFYMNNDIMPVEANVTYGYVLIADNSIDDLTSYTYSSSSGQFSNAAAYPVYAMGTSISSFTAASDDDKIVWAADAELTTYTTITMNYTGSNINQSLNFKIRLVKKDSTNAQSPVYSEITIADNNSSSVTSYDANATVALNQYYYTSTPSKTATINNSNTTNYKKGDKIFFLAVYTPTITAGYKLPTSITLALALSTNFTAVSAAYSTTDTAAQETYTLTDNFIPNSGYSVATITDASNVSVTIPTIAGSTDDKVHYIWIYATVN